MILCTGMAIAFLKHQTTKLFSLSNHLSIWRLELDMRMGVEMESMLCGPDCMRII